MQVDTEQTASGFKTKTTVGVMFAGQVIDSMVVGGPAYNSRQLDKGDFVVDIDGKAVTNDNLSQLLVGADVAGTPVIIGVKKGGKTGAKKSVTLLRMPSEAIADRRRLFELFTAMKARATLPRGRETLEGMIDNAIDLWTRMTINDAERDSKVRKKVQDVQKNSKDYVSAILKVGETKKTLFFERHDEAMGFKDFFETLDQSLEHAQIETARLTLALKEAEGEIIDLRAEALNAKEACENETQTLNEAYAKENKTFTANNFALQENLDQARSEIEKLQSLLAAATEQTNCMKKRASTDGEEIEKLKRELELMESAIKEEKKESNGLRAQADQLTRSLIEAKQLLHKSLKDARMAEEETQKTISELKTADRKCKMISIAKFKY